MVAITPDSPAADAAVPTQGKRKRVELGGRAAITNGNKHAATKKRKQSEVPVAALRRSVRRCSRTYKVVEMAARVAAKGGNSSNSRKRKVGGGGGGPVGTLVGRAGAQNAQERGQDDF